MQIHQAPLNHDDKSKPHRNLDILVVTPAANTTITQIGVLIVDEDADKVLLAGSINVQVVSSYVFILQF